MPPNRFKSAKRVADEDLASPPPKSKRVKAEGMQKDDEGNEFWEISQNRRVGISQFKGRTLINIREFYEKDGEQLPGRKGISLTMEQYAAFLEILPAVENVLKQKGQSVPRPAYDGVSKVAEKEVAKDDGGEEEEEPAISDGDDGDE